jgi:hypothetical protein
MGASVFLLKQFGRRNHHNLYARFVIECAHRIVSKYGGTISARFVNYKLICCAIISKQFSHKAQTFQSLL